MRISFSFILLFLLSLGCFPSAHAQQKLKPISFTTYAVENKANPKYALVFIYTDWCVYCKLAKQTTLRNSRLVKLINERFYYLPFHAEREDPILFREYNYRYRPDEKMHELAWALGNVNQHIAYPTFCILNPQKEIVFQHQGALPARKLYAVFEKILAMSQ